MNIPIEEFGEYALRADEPVRIAGRCTVFAESDMIHKQQEGATNEQIVAGLCEAIPNDYIFIPQYISFQEGTYCCPRVIGLPSLIRNSIPQEFNLITAQIDLGKQNFSRYNMLLLALKLSVNPVRVIKALRYFTAAIKKYGKGFNSSKKHGCDSPNGKYGLLGVVGHKYALQINFFKK